MPDNEPSHQPEQFDPAQASPELKKAFADASNEGQLEAASRKLGSAEGHQQTLEEIADMAEKQLGSAPTPDEKIADEQRRLRVADEIRAREKAEDQQAVGQLIQKTETKKTEEVSSETWQSFPDAAMALGQEGRGDVALLPDLVQLEDLVQRQFLTVESHLIMLRNTPRLAPTTEQYAQDVQDYRNDLQKQLQDRREAFVQGWRLGDAGQAERVQQQTLIDLKSVASELTKLIGALANMSGQTGRSRQE